MGTLALFRVSLTLEGGLSHSLTWYEWVPESAPCTTAKACVHYQRTWATLLAARFPSIGVYLGWPSVGLFPVPGDELFLLSHYFTVYSLSSRLSFHLH